MSSSLSLAVHVSPVTTGGGGSVEHGPGNLGKLLDGYFQVVLAACNHIVWE